MSPEDCDRENIMDEENLISSEHDEKGISATEEMDDLLEETERVKMETTVLSWGSNGSVSWLGKEISISCCKYELIFAKLFIFTGQII